MKRRLLFAFLCASSVYAADPAGECDLASGEFCKLGDFSKVTIGFHHPGGKGCLFLSTKKVTTQKLRRVLWYLVDTDKQELNFKVVSPGIEFDVPGPAFVSYVTISNRTGNRFSRDFSPLISEPGETAEAFITSEPCELRGK